MNVFSIKIIVMVIKVDFLDCKLVSNDCIGIIWDLLCDLVMISISFYVLNFVDIIKENFVSFVGVVFFNNMFEMFNVFMSRMNVW